MLPKMSRHTAVKFCLDPTVEQHDVLARHAGAARFGFNQCFGDGEDRAHRLEKPTLRWMCRAVDST
jgi:hypothetical protein